MTPGITLWQIICLILGVFSPTPTFAPLALDFSSFVALALPRALSALATPFRGAARLSEMTLVRAMGL